MVIALGILPQVNEGTVHSDLPLIREFDGERHYDSFGNELWTYAIMAIGGQAHKWQQCQRGCARFLECIVTPEFELRSNVELTHTGPMKNAEGVCLSDADRTIRLPYEAEFGGVCNADPHVRRSELKFIGNGMRVIWSRPTVADDGG